MLNAATAPRTKRVIGIFGYDVHLDGVTDTSAPIPFFAQPFITGVDVAMPAGHGTIAVVAKRRDDRHVDRHVDYLAVPNWPSTTNSISLQFDDGL